MRRLRGIVGTMVVWALAFGVVGVVATIPLSLLGELPPSPLFESLVGMFVRFALLGAGMGFAFATAILLGERRRSFKALSTRRFAAWGFVGGAIIPLGFATMDVLTRYGSMATLRSDVVFAAISGAAGAALAVVSLRAARRAPVAADTGLEAASRSSPRSVNR